MPRDGVLPLADFHEHPKHVCRHYKTGALAAHLSPCILASLRLDSSTLPRKQILDQMSLANLHNVPSRPSSAFRTPPPEENAGPSRRREAPRRSVTAANDLDESLQIELAVARSSLEDLRRQAHTTLKERDEDKARVASLEKHVTELETDIEELRELVDGLSDEAHQAGIEIAELKQERDDLSRSVVEMTTDRDDATGRCRTLEAEVMKIKSQRRDLRVLLDVASKDRDSTVGREDLLKSEIAALQSEQDGLRQSIKASAGDNHASTARIRMLEAEIVPLRSDNVELSDSVTSLRLMVDQASGRIKELESEVQFHLLQTSKQSSENTETKSEIDALNAHLRAANERVQELLGAADKREKDATERTTTLRADLEHERNRNTEMRDSAASSQAALQTQLQEIRDLFSSHVAAESEARALRVRVDELGQEILAGRDQLARERCVWDEEREGAKAKLAELAGEVAELKERPRPQTAELGVQTRGALEKPPAELLRRPSSSASTRKMKSSTSNLTHLFRGFQPPKGDQT